MRIAGDEGVGWHIAGHAGFGRGLDAVANRHMTGHTDLPAEHHAVADHGAAGDADLGRQQRVLPDRDAVGNLHEVVDLGAGLDPRLAHRRPVDGRVGADLDVVFDHDRRDLRNLLVRAVVAMREAETVAADHRAVLNDAARAELHALADRDARVQQTVGTEHRACPDHRMRQTTVRAPMRAPLSMTTYGPIETSSPTTASGATIAVG